MAPKSKTHCIGLLTSGGDCPGLNAAIRAVAKAAMREYGMKVIGFLDGFRGLVENRAVVLETPLVSGILTHGGTILGTSRVKIHKMVMGGRELNMTAVAAENLRRHQVDCLVCLGGGGTLQNALRLHAATGVNVMTVPKTIDNDVFGTDTSFGFDTALAIATEAIDRLHTTATSHHRMIVCEIMGHNTGWLTLGAGIAGGADVILIPEIPYRLEAVADNLIERRRSGSRFSIIAVAEGARSDIEARALAREAQSGKKRKGQQKPPRDGEPAGDPARAGDIPAIESIVKRRINDQILSYHTVREPMSSRLARQLQQLTGTEARVTTLGHVLRGGSPTPTDRLLCSRLGAKAAELLAAGEYNVMVAVRGEECLAVPLKEVAGIRKTVPLDHPLIRTARLIGTCLGDR